MSNLHFPKVATKKINHLVVYATICIAFLLSVSIVGLFTYKALTSPPENFPVQQVITIEEGAGVRAIASQLHEYNLIRSPLAFKALVRIQDLPPLKAGAYAFTEPLSLQMLIAELTNGKNGIQIVQLTHIEGHRVVQLASRAEGVLNNFSAEVFYELAKPYEGKLFPDTYFVPPNFTEQELVDLLHNTFLNRIEEYQSDIDNHELTLDEVITLASVLEREANSPETKSMVAGILTNRLRIGMPLQADATIEYVLDKPLSQLVPSDLEIVSPYNTYLNVGLPPTAINNPGLQAIEAALNPANTDYLYYITGRDGIFYYATNFDDHRINIARHLR